MAGLVLHLVDLALDGREPVDERLGVRGKRRTLVRRQPPGAIGELRLHVSDRLHGVIGLGGLVVNTHQEIELLA